jgi:hypothetical protein
MANIPGWINKSTMPANRTTFAENPSMSKAVRRGGVNGSKYDFPHSSTGEDTTQPPHETGSPSAPSHSHTDRSSPHQATEGWATDGSRRWIGPQHPNTSMHGLDGHHDPAKSTDGAKGQAWAAAGPRFPQSIPATKKPERPSYDHGAQPSRRADHGALAGESGGRDSYTGGRGKIRP